MGMNNVGSDIKVSINVPIDIDFKHLLEKVLDKALAPMGFSRTFSSYKEDDTAELY